MQIRIRNSRITLIRSVYDSSIKRGRSISLGTFSLRCPQIPSEVGDKLRPDEREQLDKIIRQYQYSRDRDLDAASAEGLAVTIARATKWFEIQRKSIPLTKLAQAVRDEYSLLLKAMVKAGVGRTRKRRAVANIKS
jgi:hypothetical protein